MLSFNFFDSNEWDVVSKEAMNDTIKKMREALEKSNDFIDTMQNKIATLKADNDSLRSANENMKSVIKNNSDYISELEASNEKLLIQGRVRDGVISLSSELNTKMDNQRKEITHLLKAQEKLKAELVDKEQIISSLDAKCNKDGYISELENRVKNLEHNYDEEVRMKERFKTTHFKQEKTIKKLKRDNYILREKVKEISDLAETIVELCEDEE